MPGLQRNDAKTETKQGSVQRPNGQTSDRHQREKGQQLGGVSARRASTSGHHQVHRRWQVCWCWDRSCRHRGLIIQPSELAWGSVIEFPSLRTQVRSRLNDQKQSVGTPRRAQTVASDKDYCSGHRSRDRKSSSGDVGLHRSPMGGIVRPTKVGVRNTGHEPAQRSTK